MSLFRIHERGRAVITTGGLISSQPVGRDWLTYKLAPMEDAEATSFAADWVDAWNAHDVERVLEHFSADVVFSSPVAARIVDGSAGVIRGKEALREYWSLGVRLIPDLRFEVVNTYAGVDSLVIHYRNQAGGLVCEVFALPRRARGRRPTAPIWSVEGGPRGQLP